MLELLVDEPIFIGFKASSGLRRLLESLGIADKKYISSEDSTFLRLCRIGDDLYVGKLIHDALTTDRVDDIRRNILSILRKLGPVVPLPTTLRIFACKAVDEGYTPTADGLRSRNHASTGQLPSGRGPSAGPGPDHGSEEEDEAQSGDRHDNAEHTAGAPRMSPRTVAARGLVPLSVEAMTSLPATGLTKSPTPSRK